MHLKGHRLDHKTRTSNQATPNNENYTSLLTYSTDNTNDVANGNVSNDAYSSKSSTNNLQNVHCVEYLLQENISKVSELREYVRRLLDYVTRKEKCSNDRLQNAKEWQQLAKVVDRLFFIVYVFAIVISLVYQFPKPPFLDQWIYWSHLTGGQ